MSASERYALQRAGVEHAIENEIDAFTTEQVRDMRGYVAETIAWRLRRDGFLTPARVLVGDWETVRDALDALPEGAQIRWHTGVEGGVALAIRHNRMGSAGWVMTGYGRLYSSESIARDETPIEVIA